MATSEELRSWNTTPVNSPPRSSQRVPFNQACNDSDGANFCACQKSQSYWGQIQQYPGGIDHCMYYGRSVEPLAWSIDPSSVNAQDKSPLFTTIPTEIRDKIFEYALRDCTSNPPDTDKVIRRRSFWTDPFTSLPPSDIAFPLLQTCKAIYLQAYQVPLLTNPFNIFRFGGLPSGDTARPRSLCLAPWQFALIHRLDISFMQMELERPNVGRYLDTWRAAERHDRYVVAPRFYQETRGSYPGALVQSFNFGLMSVKPDQDGVLVSVPADVSSRYPFESRASDAQTGFSSLQKARAMVARPLTHLTLRMSRTDWWTWTADPMSPAIDHLGLDPAFGTGDSNEAYRPTQPLMLKLAENRRAGQWPNPYGQEPAPTAYSGTWGEAIAKLPDLKLLELVLETFGAKKTQLETVIECAKTWRFPLGDGKYELRWDGDVEVADYGHRHGSQEPYDEVNFGFEEEEDSTFYEDWMKADEGCMVRIIRFTRARAQ